jgi:hypothetical protein
MPVTMQMTSSADPRSTSRNVLADEVIGVVHQHALALCEEQLHRAGDRLSSEQADMTRTVVRAIVGRLLAVPETRMNAASGRRDDADLLAHLFGL